MHNTTSPPFIYILYSQVW